MSYYICSSILFHFTDWVLWIDWSILALWFTNAFFSLLVSTNRAHIILHRIILYNTTISNHGIPDHNVLYRIISRRIILYNIGPYCIAQYLSISHWIVSLRIVSYHVISTYQSISNYLTPCHTVSHCIILYCILSCVSALYFLLCQSLNVQRFVCK